MNATAVVAVVGSISTPVVAIAGYLFHETSARRDRAAALDLAREGHKHELELRRRERSYDDVKLTYRAVLEWALTVIQAVQLTDPILTFADMPTAPDEPREELWNKMRIDVSVFGSSAVERALDEFRDAARSFYLQAGVVKVIQDQGGQMGDGITVRETQREAAATAYEALAATINAEVGAF